MKGIITLSFGDSYKCCNLGLTLSAQFFSFLENNFCGFYQSVNQLFTDIQQPFVFTSISYAMAMGQHTPYLCLDAKLMR
jgi:hypothetical protein